MHVKITTAVSQRCLRLHSTVVYNGACKVRAHGAFQTQQACLLLMCATAEVQEWRCQLSGDQARSAGCASIVVVHSPAYMRVRVGVGAGAHAVQSVLNTVTASPMPPIWNITQLMVSDLAVGSVGSSLPVFSARYSRMAPDSNSASSLPPAGKTTWHAGFLSAQGLLMPLSKTNCHNILRMPPELV